MNNYNLIKIWEKLSTYKHIKCHREGDSKIFIAYLLDGLIKVERVSKKQNFTLIMTIDSFLYFFLKNLPTSCLLMTNKNNKEIIF